MICLPPGWRGWAVPRPSTTTCGESTHVWLRRRPPRSQRICLLVLGSGRVGALWRPGRWCYRMGPGALGRRLPGAEGRPRAPPLFQSPTSVPEPRAFASPEAGAAPAPPRRRPRAPGRRLPLSRGSAAAGRRAGTGCTSRRSRHYRSPTAGRWQCCRRRSAAAARPPRAGASARRTCG